MTVSRYTWVYQPRVRLLRQNKWLDGVVSGLCVTVWGEKKGRDLYKQNTYPDEFVLVSELA